MIKYTNPVPRPDLTEGNTVHRAPCRNGRPSKKTQARQQAHEVVNTHSLPKYEMSEDQFVSWLMSQLREPLLISKNGNERRKLVANAVKELRSSGIKIPCIADVPAMVAAPQPKRTNRRAPSSRRRSYRNATSLKLIQA